jgi:hypothetical protein
MWIQRSIGFLAAATILSGAAAPIAAALDAPDQGGPALALHVTASRHPTGARFVPERVWQEINDAMAMKLLDRE